MEQIKIKNRYGDIEYLYASSIALSLQNGESILTNSLILDRLAGNLTSYYNSSISRVAQGAFYSCDSLRVVSLPNVTDIKSYAFTSCTYMNRLTINESQLSNIGEFAFGNCYSLSGTFNFPNVSIINSYIFYYCSRIQSLSFPAATQINGYAFYRCWSLASIYAPSVTSIGVYAFQNCYNSGISSIDFPLCSYVGDYAFDTCYNINSISFPELITIGAYAFSRCTYLTSINLPKVKVIGTYAFYSCSRMSQAVFNELTTIGSSAFYGCSKLQSLYLLGSSVVSLPSRAAFYNTPFSKSTYTGTFGSIYVPSSLVASYKTRTNWDSYANRITSYIE